MNKFLPKPVKLGDLKELIKSEEVREVSKSLDSLSLDIEAIPFFIFDDDPMEISDICTSTSHTSSMTSQSEGIHENSLKCLIIENCQTISKAMSRCVRRKGWKVCIMNDGLEGFKMLKKRRWDAVFIDDQMSSISGSTCITQFRKWENDNRLTPQKNVVLVCANSDTTVNSTSFDFVISKKFQASQIISILSAAESQRPSRG